MLLILTLRPLARNILPSEILGVKGKLQKEVKFHIPFAGDRREIVTAPEGSQTPSEAYGPSWILKMAQKYCCRGSLTKITRTAPYALKRECEDCNVISPAGRAGVHCHRRRLFAADRLHCEMGLRY